MEALFGLFITIAILAIAAVPLIILFFVIKALINYSAKKTAEEIVKQLKLREEVKYANWETLNKIHFDAIARIFIAEAKKAEEQQAGRTGAAPEQ